MQDRKQTILKAIIEDYIETAEPIASKEIATRHDFGVSPATIRNTMAELTEEGFIYQPHTSAGRVPTDRGYRFYVDSLLSRQELPEPRRKRLEHDLRAKKSEDFYEGFTAGIAAMSEAMALSAMDDNFSKVYRSGISYALRQPEYTDAEHAWKLADLFEHPQAMLEQVADLTPREPQAFIGAERALCRNLDASLLVTTFEHNGHRGIITVVGPKRMDYARNLAILRTVAQILSSGALVLLIVVGPLKP